MAKHLDLKDILHRVVESLDLNPMHRAELHDAIDIHDDPAAQAAKDAEANDERDAQVAELEKKLAELRPAPAAESTPTPTAGPTPAVPRSATTPVPAASFTPASGA
jgi:hypothetical protein